MPLTPYHLGPSSWIGLGFFRVLDLPTLLVASVIVDVESFVLLVMGYPLHGFLHSFPGGLVLVFLTVIAMYLLRGWSRRVMVVFKLAQESSFRKILWTSFLGVYLHVLLDSFTHTKMIPFYPIEGNPLLGVFTYEQIQFFCVVGFLVAVPLYLFRLAGVIRSGKKESPEREEREPRAKKNE